MNAIVAVDENWGIGKDGSLLFIIPKDLSRFKGLTKGRTILLGHETLRTFPNGKPLKNRRNVILSKNKNLRVPGAEVLHSLEEALATLDLDTVCPLWAANPCIGKRWICATRSMLRRSSAQ